MALAAKPFPWLCFNLRLNQEVSSKLAWQKPPVELREIKFLFPPHWGILTKTLTAKVITLGFCSVLNSYMTPSKITLGFYLLIWITDMCATKTMSEDCRGTSCKSTNQVLDLLFSLGYALLAGCSQTMHQLQIKREYSAISPPKYFYPSLCLCRLDQLVFFICYYLVKGLSSFTALKHNVCFPSSLLTFELCSRAVFQECFLRVDWSEGF